MTDINENNENNIESNNLEPKIVQYCEVCGFPPEYCCYGSSWSECKKWIEENYEFPELEKLQLTKEELLKEWDSVFEKENKMRQKKAEKEKDQNIVKIIVNNRGKRRFVTEIHGLDSYTDDMKEACKKVRKKFACAATLTGASMKERKSERNQKKKEKYEKRQKERENRRKRKNGIKVEEEQPKEKEKKSAPVEEKEIIELQGQFKDLQEFLVKEFKIPIEKVTN